MGRKIKFRAWDKTEKEMHNDIQEVDGIEVIVLNGKNTMVQSQPEYMHQYFNNIEYELMQYTGLKDKNGVEIYEGDVLFHPLQGRRKVYYPYSETVASYGLRDIDNGFGSTLRDGHAVWEVIGNIYENKSLLEGKE